MVARRAHNPKVVGSNPAPATNTKRQPEAAFFVSGHCVLRVSLFSAQSLRFDLPCVQSRPYSPVFPLFSPLPLLFLLAVLSLYAYAALR